MPSSLPLVPGGTQLSGSSAAASPDPLSVVVEEESLPASVVPSPLLLLLLQPTAMKGTTQAHARRTRTRFMPRTFLCKWLIVKSFSLDYLFAQAILRAPPKDFAL